MAIHAHSTTAPAVPPGLLRSGGAPCRARSHDEVLALLDELRPDLPPEPLLDLARALHSRRALEAAVEHGTALLGALGLPRLVTADFVQIDRSAIREAVDIAIYVMDLLDAPEMDLEDDDPLEKVGDEEYDLGWAANVSQLVLGQNTPDADATALERHGRGFIRSGDDDAEDGCDAEPSLGAVEQHEGMVDRINGRWVLIPADQHQWAAGSLDDRERDDDNGIADADGLAEQLAGTSLVPALAWSVGGYVG